jgi:hypothetical protein
LKWHDFLHSRNQGYDDVKYVKYFDSGVIFGMESEQQDCVRSPSPPLPFLRDFLVFKNRIREK